MRPNALRVSSAVVAAALVIGSCGEDDDAGTEVTSTATDGEATQAAPETTAGQIAAAATTSPGGTEPVSTSSPAGGGEPIKVMISGTFAGAGTGAGNSPEAETSAIARFDAQNAAGGVNGRQIEYIVCNDQANPDVAANCAREAADEEVVAVISPIGNGTGAASLPVLEEAGIAMIGNIPQAPLDFTSPNSFPFTGGTGAALAATTIAMAREGCTKVAALAYSTGISQPSIAFIERAIAAEGGELAASVEVTPDAPDYAPAVATAIDAGAECIIPVTTPNDVVKVVKSVEESGADLQIGALVSQFPGTTLESLGESAEGIIASDSFYSVFSDEPAVVQYRAEVEPVEDILSRTGLSAWSGAQLFIKVVESLDDPTAASFLDAMNNLENMDLGTLPPFSMNEELDSEGFNRAFIRSLFINVVEDGQFRLLYDEPIDATATYP